MPKLKLPKSPSGCPMDSLLRLLMGQWTSYILWVLRNNTQIRFGALKRSVSGVSAKVLTERLRSLEEAGVIYREVIPSNPPQVNYGLTERGNELSSALDQLNSIALRWAKEDGKPIESHCTLSQVSEDSNIPEHSEHET